ncbi:hypothetical protein FSP39_012962 [Pinctada imbricata]|uniref:Kazal-like domain-containing protein n=1 Tax=Pinctada imbricata TaxID=66713 RepID=A0AA88XD48_PINIB|nr:hypothetical protein FSP39_012962 [Pinctada imbricata]
MDKWNYERGKEYDPELISASTQTEKKLDNQETQTEFLSPWLGFNSVESLHQTKNTQKTECSTDPGDEEKTEEWERQNLRYGWGSFTPDCLQVFNTIRWFVFFSCVFSLFQGFIVNGVINAIISTLESRFELPSSRSGLIVSSNDFLAFFLVLLVSYYGGQKHKPKLIGAGIIVLGIGSFIFSLPHFLTDTYNVSEGLIYCAASLGVAAGYMLGGQTLSLFTEFNIMDKEDIGITPLDPRWVGAWWISFLISGTVMLLIALPLLGFPKRLPGSAKLQAERQSEAYQEQGGQNVKDDKVKSWKDFPLMLWALLRNPTFLFLALATCTEGIIVNGVASFGAKFMQEKFNLPAAFAALLMGIVTVPGAGGGMLLGGYLVKRLELKCRGIIRMDIIVGPRQSLSNLSAACNAGCGCSAAFYKPVCGLDGSMYFTPCHAGCSSEHKWMEGPMGPFKMYTNCECVKTSMAIKQNLSMQNDVMTTASQEPEPEVTSSVNNSSNSTMMGPPPGAYQGVCMSDCKLVWVTVPLLFVGMLMTFTTVSPTQTATLRCVQESQRSLAIGFQWLFLRLLGTTPGPLMLGAIIDSACVVWQDINGETGSCWIYEKTDMGIKILIWWCIVKGFSVLFYFLAQYFYISPEKEIPEEEKNPLHPVELLEGKESVL